MAESPVENSADIDALEDASVRTVDELNDEIAATIESTDDLYFDYVVGDVTDHRAVNGHVHFDLDNDDASIHCIIFGSRRAGTTDDIDDGTQVAVAGDLSYYEQQGSCSILVTDVVELGNGTYQQVYRENKEALDADGLLDDQYKQALPALPRRVGIVTSVDSDAREDAITSIHDRHPDVDVVLHHASVQGETALPSLLEGISLLDRDPEIDVIVVTRGGGADTTLRVFNEPALCRAIFNTDTPSVVGVGHERDQTLAGEVVDERVMTPTDVGSIVPEKAGLREEHTMVAEELDEAYERMATARLTEIEEALKAAYTDHATTVLTDVERDLDLEFETLARERLTKLDNQLDHARERVEQESKFEREKEAATQELEATYARRQRLQQAAIIMLLLVLLALTAYVLLGQP